MNARTNFLSTGDFSLHSVDAQQSGREDRFTPGSPSARAVARPEPRLFYTHALCHCLQTSTPGLTRYLFSIFYYSSPEGKGDPVLQAHGCLFLVIHPVQLIR